jgi:hypothetical protein
VTAFGPHSLPWWPDTFVVGVFMGLLAAFILMRLTFLTRDVMHFRRAAGLAMRWVGTRLRP